MPVISSPRRYSTTAASTTASSYLPPAIGGTTTHRYSGSYSSSDSYQRSTNSYLSSSYRSSGHDTSPSSSCYSNRFGVSSTRYSSLSSASNRGSLDRESFRKSLSSYSSLNDRGYLSGGKSSSLEKESNRKSLAGIDSYRDRYNRRSCIALDSGNKNTSGYDTLPITKSKYSSSTRHESSPLSSSSLARTVALAGVDLFEKYSPAHYIPKCELSRSRSLSDATTPNDQAELKTTTGRKPIKDYSEKEDEDTNSKENGTTSMLATKVKLINNDNCLMHTKLTNNINNHNNNNNNLNNSNHNSHHIQTDSKKLTNSYSEYLKFINKQRSHSLTNSQDIKIKSDTNNNCNSNNLKYRSSVVGHNCIESLNDSLKTKTNNLDDGIINKTECKKSLNSIEITKQKLSATTSPKVNGSNSVNNGNQSNNGRGVTNNVISVVKENPNSLTGNVTNCSYGDGMISDKLKTTNNVIKLNECMANSSSGQKVNQRTTDIIMNNMTNNIHKNSSKSNNNNPKSNATVSTNNLLNNLNNNNNNNNDRAIGKSSSQKTSNTTRPDLALKARGNNQPFFMTQQFKDKNFLKNEYELARSQVTKSAPPVRGSGYTPADISANINSIQQLSLTGTSIKVNPITAASMRHHQGSMKSSISSGATASNRHSPQSQVASKSAYATNRSTVMNDTRISPVRQSPVLPRQSPKLHLIDRNGSDDTLDDIKYIDSDEGIEKKTIVKIRPDPKSTVMGKPLVSSYYAQHNGTMTSPFTRTSESSSYPNTTSTLPSMSKRTMDMHANKYNTLNSLYRPTAVQAGKHELTQNRLSSNRDEVDARVAKIDFKETSIDEYPKVGTMRSTPTRTMDVLKLLSTNNQDYEDNIRNTSIRSGLPPSSAAATNRYSRLISETEAPSKSNNYGRRNSTEESDDGLCGLRNIGNTCFMNSVLQCLSHTNELMRYMKTHANGLRTTTKDQRILAEFAKLIRDMWTPNNRSVTPMEFKSAFSSKYRMYSGSAQQDAQEFLRFFLDALHCALNTGTKGEHLQIDDSLSDNKKADLTWEWYSKSENSVIKDLFVGQLKSTLRCTTCGNTSVTFDPFWDLSVSLPSSSRCKLDSCLELFIREEILDGDEMPTCSKCKQRRKCTKSFTIQRFPKYLVIHLKRFSETRWSKMTNIVEFPTGERELNMAPYASNSSSPVLYTLYGISNHMGSTAGGHYVALCKHPINRKWHEFNDNVVSASSGGDSLVSSSAYLLFYERA